MAITLNRLGLALESRFPEAESTFQQALAMREALLAQIRRACLPFSVNLVRVYTEEGKGREAADTRRRATNISSSRNPRG